MVALQMPSAETRCSAEAVSSLLKARAAALVLLWASHPRAQPLLRPQCALRTPAESVRSLNPNPASSTFGAVATSLGRRTACNTHGRCMQAVAAGMWCACALACCTNTLLAVASRHALQSFGRAAAAVDCKRCKLRAPGIPCRRVVRCARGGVHSRAAADLNTAYPCADDTLPVHCAGRAHPLVLRRGADADMMLVVGADARPWSETPVSRRSRARTRFVYVRALLLTACVMAHWLSQKSVHRRYAHNHRAITEGGES